MPGYLTQFGMATPYASSRYLLDALPPAVFLLYLTRARTPLH